jgi:AcrR family transcriptional regulator
MTTAPPTRRERLRRQTLEEIRHHALEQVVAGGPSAVSLNSIARSMGMSGPAIYRYFASRDELLDSLVTAGYGELSAALAQAEQAAAGSPPAARFAAVTAAYREWARRNPRYYGMLFGVRPDGLPDSPQAIEAINASMVVVVRILGELTAGAVGSAAEEPLEADLAGWSARRELGEDLPPELLRLGVLTWTRLHGIVSLEVAGIFGDMGVDAGPLAEYETAAIIAEAARAAEPQRAEAT